MRRASIFGTAAALCLFLGAAACSGSKGPSEAEMVDDLSETLQAGGYDFDEETADCFAKIVVDEVGVDELKDINLSADEPSEEIQDAIGAATVQATDECNLAGDPG